MNDDQFNRLLSWTILGTLHSAQMLMQNQLGRELTLDEQEKCYKDAYAHADLIRDELAVKRK